MDAIIWCCSRPRWCRAGSLDALRTGGVAFGNVKNTVYLTDGIETLSGSQSKSLAGWTSGAGVDYAASDNVIVRLEYCYTDYGHKDFRVANADIEFDTRNKFKSHDIRLGVAYKF